MKIRETVVHLLVIERNKKSLFHFIVRHFVAKLLHHIDRAREIFGHPLKVKRKISAADFEFTVAFVSVQPVVVVVTDAYAAWQQVLQDYPLQSSLYR